MNSEVEPSGENQSKDRFLTVEIGTSQNPISSYSEDRWEDFMNDPNVRYVGIDINEEDIRKVASHSWDNRKKFTVADGEQLPLKDEIADEVVLANVFGDQIQHEAV
jgi:hypothetical protein